MIVLLSLANLAFAQSRVPDRQIPPAVLSELALLEGRFDLAIAADCDPDQCFSKGCAYVDHAVADRPKSRSLPGLGQEPGPGSVEAQEYLTRARCSFAYEASLDTRYVQALGRRLQSKLSKGWTVVSVDHQRLQPLPEPEPAEEDEVEPVEEPEVVAPAWSIGAAVHELWTSLLPHFFWMIAVVMVTFAGTALIWAWRRVGRESIEDKLLLAELAREGDDDTEETEASDTTVEDSAFVAQQEEAWTTRLEAMDRDHPDPEIQALIHELLRSGDMALLAKAVLRFPESFPAAFPTGGEIASAKLELADYLKTADSDALPADAEFFRSLNRHALSAALASQSDAQVVRSIREEFGASGLAMLITRLDPRPGALLFALAPADEQQEIVRLLNPAQVADLAEMLLRSNRMDPLENAHLFEVLAAVRSDQPLPTSPPSTDISDRGNEFDAVGALSVLLESVNPSRRSALFGAALARFQGNLPSWYRGILVADMLHELSDEARSDLLLEVDAQGLAAWLSLLDGESVERMLDGVPESLRSSVRASEVFASRARQLALAAQTRRDLARGFQQQLARQGVHFESIVHTTTKGDP